MNENDKIREAILRYLYDRSKSARSVSETKVTESVILRTLRTDYQTSDIVSHLIYLVQAGWVKQEKINKLPYYTIGTPGVNHFEGVSMFQKSQWVTGINVTNIQGVTVIGDNNYVNQEFNDLYKNLDLLKSEIGKSASLVDQDKLEYQSEIDTIKSQLAKKTPNKTIISQAWKGLSALSTIDGITNIYTKIAPLISGLLVN